MATRKVYEYAAVSVAYDGHLDDGTLLSALCEHGKAGWRRVDSQYKDATHLVLLLERETQLEGVPPNRTLPNALKEKT